MAKTFGGTRVIIAGRFGRESLELSYSRAFTKLGVNVTHWDMPGAIDRSARMGRIGRYINQFWPSEPWIAKANGAFLTAVLDTKPDIVFICGGCKVLVGTLAQIKTSLPQCQLVFLWPDTLLNCYSLTIDCISVYDLVATYSKQSVEAFTRLGARRTEWVPLGFDPELHPPGRGTSED